MEVRAGGEPYRLYNLDVFEYLPESPFGLYGAIPLMLAHKKGLTVGAFWCVAVVGLHPILRAKPVGARAKGVL